MIQLDGISRSYAGQTVLHELSWRIADRERIAAAMREFNAAVMHVEEESLLVESQA